MNDAFLSFFTTLLAIALSISLWIIIFVKLKRGHELKQLILPLILWIILGSADILVTAYKTAGYYQMEANPLARIVFAQFGVFGPAIASILWISLWASVIFLILTALRNNNFAFFLNLAILYGLATDHLVGFTSWVFRDIYCLLTSLLTSQWIQWIQWIFFGPGLLNLSITGFPLAFVHYILVGFIRNKE